MTHPTSLVELKKSLVGGNPLRQDIEYTNRDILFLSIVKYHSQVASLIRGYNDVIKYIRDFASKMPEFKAKYGRNIFIKVKVTSEASTRYLDVSTEAPNVFLRNKTFQQRISICGRKQDGSLEDIKLIPFMFGCQWCVTSYIAQKTLSPSAGCVTSCVAEETLQSLGEDACYSGGFFIFGGSAKYILAHEKVSHNLVMVLDGVASLKTQDERNNSIELTVYKDKKTKSYLLTSTSFKDDIVIEVLDVIKQIYLLIKDAAGTKQDGIKDASSMKQNVTGTSLCNLSSFKHYISDLIELVSGSLKDFVSFDINDKVTGSNSPITPVAGGAASAGTSNEVVLKHQGNSMEEALNALFKNDDIRSAHTLGSHLNDLNDYPKVVIESILSNVKDYDEKARALMKILVSLVLVEHGIMPVSDRDNLGFKSYLTAAEIFKRDLTMNNGERLRDEVNKIYEPGTSVSKGDSDVIETLDMTKTFKALSEMTTLSTPMSAHSKNIAVRAVNASHTGFKCPSHTPSGKKIGLVNHMALTCCISRSHLRSDIERVINEIQGTSKGRFVKGEIPLLINSIAFGTATQEEVTLIKSKLKRHPELYDTAFIPECYTQTRSGEDLLTSDNDEVCVKVVSYNIMCDGGRLYRPLFVTSKILSLSSTSENRSVSSDIERYIEGKDVLQLISEGFIEMVFAVELTFYTISESVEQLNVSSSGANATSTGTVDRLDVTSEYCEINPVAIYGTNGSCAPMFNHNPGGRAIHECAMANSALTFGSTNMPSLSETSSKLLYTSTRAAVTTLMNEYYSRYYGNGICATMMIKVEQENIEDADVISDTFARTVVTKRSNTIEVEVEQGVKLGVPPSVLPHNRNKYHCINPDTNLPILNTELTAGDCVFAMYRMIPPKEDNLEGIEENRSKFVDVGDEGFISKFKVYPQGNSIIYRITISSYKHLEKGDKLASRYSQKGVIGGIIPFSKLPVVIGNTPYKGVKPQIIFSPLSLTSRATPGVVNELLLGNYAVMTGRQVDATAFTVSIERMNQIARELQGMGFQENMMETLLDPNTGRTFQAYIGVCYIRVLEHTSHEKLKACSQINSSTNKLNRQPTQGGLTGGLREGDMELHTMAAHSGASLINRMFSEQSDAVTIAICGHCGHYNDRLGILSDTDTINLEHTKCIRCNSKELRATRTNFGMVREHNHLLSAGVKLDVFPDV